MTFVIIGGFIDLSVAGTINLVAVVTISLIQTSRAGAGAPRRAGHRQRSAAS